ncbi:hypothetical protein EYF80_038528 [Liparis tanakae]|uniref:Uncharacterized protein n=1 Tax=Liparis tanakae TaxID=230148 RepID=A0A4Z2GCI2_9TELE|nr:hypothetical protein EYF80_038528 [Liparis tanakae]
MFGYQEKGSNPPDLRTDRLQSTEQDAGLHCDGTSIGTDDSSSPPPVFHPSLPPSILLYIPSSHLPSLPRHLEPASRDTRGREGAMMKGQGTGKRRGGERTTEGWMRERRRKEGKDERSVTVVLSLVVFQWPVLYSQHDDVEPHRRHICHSW